MTKITKILIAAAILLISSKAVLAAPGDLSVKIESPKSPTNQNSFNVNLVALDILDRPVTVKCFKKGPSDSGFSQFGSDFNLDNGGNSDNCVVDSNIVNGQGTYQFYVLATAGEDSVTSGTVAVDYNTSGPSTPVAYSKEKINDCTWKIKFTTASDNGKTVKVEAYRSDNPSYNADPSNRFASIAISSGQNGETSITVPNCAHTWYFSVRAFDSAGNGSGVIGDSVVTTTTVNPPTTNTTTQGGQALLASQSQVGQGDKSTTTDGEESTNKDKDSDAKDGEVLGENGEVDGASTQSQNNTARNIILVVLAVIIGYYVFKNKDKVFG